MEAVEKLKGEGGGRLSDLVVFWQLDVRDQSSIASLADFVKNKFGRLDILVNNAGITGTIKDWDALKPPAAGDGALELIAKFTEITTQNYELAKECVHTNYYGAKWMIDELIPLLQLSDSPRIVNVSPSMGKLKDFEEGSLETRGWPASFSAYVVSKAAMNAHTRILAKKYPNFLINCVCPGFVVETDINRHIGFLSVEEGAEFPVKLALLPDDGPTGLFFFNDEVSSFDE